MMPDSPSPQPLSLQELTQAVLNQLVAGRSQDAVTQSLVARGWPEVSARQFVVNTAQSVARPHVQVEQDDERHVVAELFRRRALRDLMLTTGFLLAMLIAGDLFPSAPALTLFFLSMCTCSFVDLVVALIGWWHHRE
jgi:hypothetical protein